MIPLLFSSGGSTPTVTSGDIIGAIQPVVDQFSISNITGFIVALLSVTVVFGFLWWGVRLAYRRITGSAKGGRRLL